MGATLFVNASQVVTCNGPPRARRGAEMRDATVLTDAAVAIERDKIVAVGELAMLERAYPGAARIDCARGVLTPGLVDSHTHAIFGRPRAGEQEMRASGLGYMEIAAAGGGIHASVRDLRQRSEDELVSLARARLMRLASYGTTTVEVKSGYGLTVDDELKMLRAIARLSAELPMRLVPTWLGAHEIPLEARASDASRGAYIRLLTEEMLPKVTTAKLAKFADVFCEPGVFTLAESRTILAASRAHGLELKIHADELKPYGGAELAVELGAVSADHLAAISPAGIAALEYAGTVATLLPGTMFFLGKGTRPPARALIDGGAAVALATDFNPGTSPTVNFPLILTIGVSELKMSVAEVLIAATVNGAAALALADHVGQLAPGFSADLALFEIEDIRELPYWYGDRRCRGTWSRGKPCHPYGLSLS
jgi:imidazolonepropionase